MHVMTNVTKPPFFRTRKKGTNSLMFIEPTLVNFQKHMNSVVICMILLWRRANIVWWKTKIRKEGAFWYQYHLDFKAHSPKRSKTSSTCAPNAHYADRSNSANSKKTWADVAFWSSTECWTHVERNATPAVKSHGLDGARPPWEICDFFTIPTHALKSQVRSEKSHVLVVLIRISMRILIPRQLERKNIGKTKENIVFSFPRRAQDVSRRSQDAPRCSQDAPKTRPRRPKDAAKTPQDAPKTRQDVPRWSKAGQVCVKTG